MNIRDLKVELFNIAKLDSYTDADQYNSRKWNAINNWFDQHVLQLTVASVMSLDYARSLQNDKDYLKYHRSNIIHRMADALLENKSVTETKLVSESKQDRWDLYEQRTESKLWVLK